MIEVGSGAELTASDLQAGLFNGDAFTLGSELTFNVQAGGVVEPLGQVAQPFDMAGSSMVLGTGGHFDGPSDVLQVEVDILSGGVMSDDVTLRNSVLTIDGGELGDSFDAFGSRVVMLDGRIGEDFNASSFSEVEIFSGVIGPDAAAFSGSNFTIHEGNIGDSFDVFDSTVNVYGGDFGVDFDASSGSIVNIHGGSFKEDFDAFAGSEINLFGVSFTLGGVPLTGLPIGKAVVIEDRDVNLSGVLTNGDLVGFDLLSDRIAGEGFFARQAIVTVTIVPEPSASIVVLLASSVIFIRSTKLR